MSNTEDERIFINHLRIILGAGWLYILVAIAISIYMRFSHAELTETQLFLQFWPAWIGVAIMLGFGVFWVRQTY